MKFILTTVCLAAMVGAGFVTASAQSIPDPNFCSAWTAATETVSVANNPDGTGRPLSAAQTASGGTMDATITVELLDAGGFPVVGFPAYGLQIAIFAPSGGFVTCVVGAHADGPTDINGRTTFSGPIAAGGYDNTGSIEILVAGAPISSGPMDIWCNSPDLDGNLMVNVVDVSIFTNLFNMGGYDYSIDLNYDGVIDIQDLAVMNAAMNTACSVTEPPDPFQSYAEISGFPGNVSVLNNPDGTGNPLTNAQLSDGSFVDATISVYLYDALGNPVVGYPADWLDLDVEFGIGNFVKCPGGLPADGPTGFAGETTFSGTIPAGGNSEGDFVIVKAAGIPIQGSMDMWFNSPDINGDLQVDAADNTLFNNDYFGGYNYRSDFFFDLILGISDLTIFAAATYPENTCGSGSNGTVIVDVTPDMVGAAWVLEGAMGFYQEGVDDLILNDMPPDDYALTWLGSDDWYNDCPSPDFQTLVSGAHIVFECAFHEYGTLIVNPDPDFINAPWTVSGPDAYEYSGSGNMTLTHLRAGEYSIVWDEVPGWLMPCEPPITVMLAEGGVEIFACTYLERGTVIVDAEPDAIGADWLLTGPEVTDMAGSGDIVLTDMAPGDYYLTWISVTCWTSPSYEVVHLVLDPGGSITFFGLYIENGTINVDGEPVEITPTWHLSGPGGFEYDGAGDETLPCLTAGMYTLEWLPVPGWILSCPEPVPMELLPGGTLDFACTYGEAGTVVINPDPDFLGASWHLSGPGGLELDGSGDLTLPLQPAGNYTLTWSDVPYWVEPVVNPESQLLEPEQTIVFHGVYEPLPEILSIVDVENDQGRRVRITWRRCAYDAATDPVINAYGIYRRQDAYKGAMIPEGGIRRDADGKLEGWDALGMIPARMDETYQYVAETLCDFTVENGDCLTTFMISAITPDPGTFFDSRPDSGQSIDNLVPSVPAGFVVSYAAGGNELSWNPNPEEDIRYYKIYRAAWDGALGGQCGPLPATAAADVAGPGWTDGENAWGVCYYVTAVDFAGNESEPTVWSGASLIGVEDNNMPTQFALHNNVPNPFNPITTIAYDLPRASSARLVIYDASGRQVRVLVDEPNQDAGRHEIIWRGRDQHGSEVAAGVYFYRLEARGYSATERMVFLK